MTAADRQVDFFDHRLLDEQLSSRLRLAVMSVLLGCQKIEFTVLRDTVHATDGNLTVHCKKLENAGYLTVEKRFVNRKPVTLYSATPLGRRAVKKYAQQLASLLEK
ncbi:transcriptional regulator [Treponema sp. Marseille-Q4130]|uniref:winged helix-turn-helix domain-containing protein n=1 Tax=Treponema sp. Marseille-Q4130 TaxID=2766702 RepID=UPI0016526673|nr:transcriptional regulator [Treponema sp. Marseille-Q4130]MBC6719005.1 transcriptional regulator [Treponema sp. Marseille-Q4130]